MQAGNAEATRSAWSARIRRAGSIVVAASATLEQEVSIPRSVHGPRLPFAPIAGVWMAVHALAGCNVAVDPFGGAVTFEAAHDCVDAPSAVQRVGDRALIGCDLQPGVGMVDLSAALWGDGAYGSEPAVPPPGILLVGPDGLQVKAMQALGGRVYVSGALESGDGSHAAVFTYADEQFDPLFDGSAFDGMETVVGFARHPAGLDLVVGDDATFAIRRDGGPWATRTLTNDADLEGWSFSRTGHDVVVYEGQFMALARHEGQSLVLVQDGAIDALDFAPVAIDLDGEDLTGIAADDLGLALSYADSASARAGVVLAAGGLDGPLEWHDIPLEDPFVKAVCRHGGRTVAVGQAAEEGFAYTIEADGTTSLGSFEVPLHACHVDATGALYGGERGLLHVKRDADTW
jgi:hypothetical protein